MEPQMDIIETIEDEMVCANDCPEKGNAHYNTGHCNCYKREVIQEVKRLLGVERTIKEIIHENDK